jgi:hypothetical protein
MARDGIRFNMLRRRLDGGGATTVYVVRYPRARTRLDVRHFPRLERPDRWCRRVRVREAIVGASSSGRMGLRSARSGSTRKRTVSGLSGRKRHRLGEFLIRCGYQSSARLSSVVLIPGPQVPRAPATTAIPLQRPGWPGNEIEGPKGVSGLPVALGSMDVIASSGAVLGYVVCSDTNFLPDFLPNEGDSA